MLHNYIKYLVAIPVFSAWLWILALPCTGHHSLEIPSYGHGLICNQQFFPMGSLASLIIFKRLRFLLHAFFHFSLFEFLLDSKESEV